MKTWHAGRVIERSVILTNGPELRVAIPDNKPPAGGRQAQDSLGSGVSERARILNALDEAKGLVRGPTGSRQTRPQADDAAIVHAQIQHRSPVSIMPASRAFEPWNVWR